MKRGVAVTDEIIIRKEDPLLVCDKSRLVDITAIQIDTDKPKARRMEEFVRQIKNPYLFKVGDVIVKVSFRKDGATLQKAFESLVMENLGI